MKIAIIEKATNKIVETYEADAIDSSSARRSWLRAEPMCAHVEIPAEIDAAVTKAVLVEATETEPARYDIVADDDLKRAANAAAKAQYAVERERQSDAEIAQIMAQATGQSREFMTHQSIYIKHLSVLVDPTSTEGERAESQAVVDAYKAAYAQVEASMAQRDADVDAFVPPYAGV